MIIPELKQILDQQGVRLGDTICVFSDITPFGIPLSVKEAVKAQGVDYLLESYIETFKNSVGAAGLVVMPTLTYSACKNEVFDVQNTPSTVGVLSNYFMKLPDVHRSFHPIFSFAAWGNDAASFVALDGYNCFGKESLFEKLFQRNAWYILFGVDMQHGATYIYYTEQKLKVYYRYFKDFDARIKNGLETLRVTCRYFVRNLEKRPGDNFYVLEQEGLKRGVISSAVMGNGRILFMRAQPIDSLIQEMVLQNKDYLITYDA